MAAGSGSLGRLDLKPPEDLETGAKGLQVYNDAVSTVAAMGLTLPQAPADGYRGEMPSDITSLDDDELGDHLHKLSQFIGYVEAELSKAEVAREEAKAKLEYIRARVRIGVKAQQSELGGKLTVQDKNDLVDTEPRVREAKSRELYTEAVYRLTKTILNKAQRDWDTVSRRITQRGQEVERMKRENNVAGIPLQSRTFRRP